MRAAGPWARLLFIPHTTYATSITMTVFQPFTGSACYYQELSNRNSCLLASGGRHCCKCFQPPRGPSKFLAPCYMRPVICVLQARPTPMTNAEAAQPAAHCMGSPAVQAKVCTFAL